MTSAGVSPEILRRGPGGRIVHENLLPYPRFPALLQLMFERKYGFMLAVEIPEKAR